MAITRTGIAMATPVPLRTDFDAAQLRKLAKRSRDPDQTRPLLALAAIYDGAARTEAAQIGSVTLQIVRDWVLRFNAKGPGGLVSGPGRPRCGPKKPSTDSCSPATTAASLEADAQAPPSGAR